MITKGNLLKLWIINPMYLATRSKPLKLLKTKSVFWPKTCFETPHTNCCRKRECKICSQELFKEETGGAANMASDCLHGISSCLLPGREEKLENWLELLGNVAVQAPVQNLFFTTFSVDILQFCSPAPENGVLKNRLRIFQ